MENVINEIIIEFLVIQNGFTRDQATHLAPDYKGSDEHTALKTILNKRFGKMLEFTTHISKLEKGCAPSVGLMDTRIDIAQKAIDKFKE